MNQSIENLFEALKLSDDSLTESSSQLLPVNSNETRLKLNSSDELIEAETSQDSSVQTVKVFLRFNPKAGKSKRGKKGQKENYIVMNSKTLLTKLSVNVAPTNSSRNGKSSIQAEKKFYFTKIFESSSSQFDVFQDCASQPAADLLAGKNSTLISYGTKNSGKTYTFFGSDNSLGIIPRVIEYIFSRITSILSPRYKPMHGFDIIALDDLQKSEEIEVRERLLSSLINKQSTVDTWYSFENSLKQEKEYNDDEAFYSVWISFAEIYNENIYDLLGELDEEKISSLKLITDKQGRPFVPGLTMVYATTGLEAFEIMRSGQSRLSSRSHSIFTLTILKYLTNDSPENVEISTLTFCDLAGSGKLQNAQAVGDSVQEVRNIKTGLLTLRRCLKCVLESQSSKINAEILGPFRESKLTRLFQRALSGKEFLTIVANLNPSPDLFIENQTILNLCSIARKILITPTKEIKRTFTSDQSVPSLQISSSVHEVEDDIEHLQKVNQKLKNELQDLKFDASNQKLNVRKEMTNLYSEIIEHTESRWKKYAMEIEKNQTNILKWSVQQVELFYEKRIDSLSNRKRRRTDSVGDKDDLESPLKEMLDENMKLTSKLMTTNKILQDVKIECFNLRQEKNTFDLRLGLANEAIQEIRELLRFEDGKRDSSDYKNLIDRLKTVLSEKNIKIEFLENQLCSVDKSESQIHIETESSEKCKKMPKESLSNLFFGKKSFSKESSLSENDKSGYQNVFDTDEEKTKDDSGFESNRILSSTRCSLNISLKDDSKDQKIINENRFEALKFDYKKLKSDYLKESIRVCELSEQLEKLNLLIKSLKETILQNEKNILEYQRKLTNRENELEILQQCKIDLECKLSNIYLDVERSSVKCNSEHVQKIEKLELELEKKKERVSELEEKVFQSCRDLTGLSKLNDRVSEFANVLEKCRHEREDLRRQLQERTLSQSSLECRLKLLSSRVQDRENEIMSLRTDLADIFRLNIGNSECVNELNRYIGDAVAKLTITKKEMRRSEVERKNAQHASSHEISNLTTRLACYHKNAEIYGIKRQTDDSVRKELEEIKEKLLLREKELKNLKKNRDFTIRRYESLVRKLQRDFNRYSRESLKMKKMYLEQSFSKDSLKSMEIESLNSLEVRPGFLVKAKSSLGRSSVRKRRSHNQPRLTSSSLMSSSQILLSLSSVDESKSSEAKIPCACYKSRHNSGHTSLALNVVQNKKNRECSVKDFQSIISPKTGNSSMSSGSDQSTSDYKEVPSWTKIMRANIPTQFVIHQAEITVENATEKKFKIDVKNF